MASHIHPVALIIHSLCDAADLAALFKEHNFIFVRRAKQFIGRCQAGGSSADNNDFFLHFMPKILSFSLLSLPEILYPAACRRVPALLFPVNVPGLCPRFMFPVYTPRLCS